SVSAGNRRKKGDLVAIMDRRIHRREVVVDGARYAALEHGNGRVGLHAGTPDVVDRCAIGRLAGVLARAGQVAQPGVEADRYAHARSMACRRRSSFEGSASGPSTHASPPSKNSCFHTGTICLTRSIPYRQTWNDSARCAAAAATATLTSPISSRPIRW